MTRKNPATPLCLATISDRDRHAHPWAFDGEQAEMQPKLRGSEPGFVSGIESARAFIERRLPSRS